MTQALLLPAFSLWWREVKRFLRQRNRLVGAMGTPIVFWLLLGSGLGRSFHSPHAPVGMGYLEYFFPGTIALMVLFTAIFATFSIIEDRQEGFLQAVLVAPVPRAALVLGKILGTSTLAVLQGLLFLALAPLAGIALSLQGVLASILVMALLAFGLSGLGFLLAWRMDSVQGFHAIMNLFLMPLWLLSGAVFPVSGSSGWIAWLMKINPVSYGVAALRRALYLGPMEEAAGALGDLPSMAACVGVSAGFAGILFLWVLLIARRPSRA